MECGQRVPRLSAVPIRDAMGNLIGYLCRECHQQT